MFKYTMKNKFIDMVILFFNIIFYLLFIQSLLKYNNFIINYILFHTSTHKISMDITNNTNKNK